MSNFETFLWVELIAFDSSAPDLGVKQYFDCLGFTPAGISIFMWGSDFVHLHDGMKEDALFPPDIGSYLDIWSDGPKRSGAPWSKFQLRALIEELHRYGVKVLFSIFPTSLGDRFHPEWVTRHSEVGYVSVKGMESGLPIIDPLKRLADGTFYEDFLLKKVLEVIEDYGFDGWHLADGYNHSWFQLCHADWSDDMIEQFLASGIAELPPEIPVCCAGDRDAEDARARYIWRELRSEWITFHRKRNESYLRKIVDALHARGKIVTSNTCWTRDPVEAIYRYGIDYRQLAAIGIDRLVIETCSAGGELLDHICRARFSVPFFQVINTTILLSKACAPEAKFLFNNCTQDITEGWSILRHAPAFLEREILTYSNLYHYDSDGIPRKCFDGLQVCLAADIEPHEWKFLRSKWQLGFGTEPVATGGITLLWSDGMIEAELKEYLASRRALTAKILYELLNCNVPVEAVVPLRDMDKVPTPLLAINPGLWSAAERRKLLEHRNAPLFLFGILGEEFREVGIHWREGDTEFCFFDPAPAEGIVPPETEVLPEPKDLRDIPEPPTFFDEQYYRPISVEFYRACAAVMRRAGSILEPVAVPDHSDIPFYQVKSYRLVSGVRRCLVGNNHWQYILSEMQTTFPVKEARIGNGFQLRPLHLVTEGKNTRFTLRIPPKGIGVIDLVPECDRRERKAEQS